MTSSSPLVEQILSGRAPAKLKEYAADGIVPLPAHELIPLQVVLTNDQDSVIAEKAHHSLRQVSLDTWIELVGKKDPHTAVIDFCLHEPSIPAAVREKILLNHTVSDDVMARVAATHTGALLDLLISNHVRLLRSPGILSALEANRRLTIDQRRRVEEFKAEFIFKKQQEPLPRDLEEISTLSFDDILTRIPNLDVEAQRILREADTLAQEEPTEEQVNQTLRTLFSTEEMNQLPGEVLTTYQRILKMKVGEKLRAALLGTKDERFILVRDANKLVASMVLRNPKITDPEVENYSQMRNLDSDLLRQIGQHREFIKRYSVIHNLVRNPKTPSPISLNLLKLLREVDLRNLARDRNIPEIIRRQAKKIYDLKQATRS